MTNEEVSRVIEDAFSKVMPEIEGYEEGDLLIDWVLIAAVTNPNDDSGYAYPMFFMNGEAPAYRTLGLFATGTKLLGQNLHQEG